MEKMLDHFKVIAESATGFWIMQPVPTGRIVRREEWLQLSENDPEHYQIIEFSPYAQLTLQSITEGVILERALTIIWSDELLQTRHY